MKTCAYCGETFTARRSDKKYCQELCARRAYQKRRLADGRYRAYQQQNRDRLTEYNQENRGRWYVDRTCVMCGSTWRTHRKDAKYCSRECFIKAGREGKVDRRPPSRRARARRKLTKAAKGTRAKIAWAQGQCHRCGSTFVAQVFADIPKFCTVRCKRLTKSERRRAMKSSGRVGTVRRWEVFERDNWVCQLCGDPLDRDAITPDAKSPSVDHIVPLFKGGAHSMDNVQSAHLLCNSRKSDTLVVLRLPSLPTAA